MYNKEDNQEDRRHGRGVQYLRGGYMKKIKRPIYIIVNGKVVDNADCDCCNYNECESCPTWHGDSLEVNDDETTD